MKDNLTIAVDFDGTCVDHRYPDIGADVPFAVLSLKLLTETLGAKVILNTMRSGEYLAAAVNWFSKNNIQLYGINSHPDQHTWTHSPKVYANKYIDDAAVGCPLIEVPGFARPCVDWNNVMYILRRD